ncbi:hypothetical protein N9Y42_00785 [Mariniblastus sp.]|nr:hypothetical protein [Mariniblastus sp.]
MPITQETNDLGLNKSGPTKAKFRLKALLQTKLRPRRIDRLRGAGSSQLVFTAHFGHVIAHYPLQSSLPECVTIEYKTS